MSKFLPLMRVGIFRDRHGVNYDITKSVLEKVAKAFNAANPPHLLVGHPDRQKVPSFGVVDALKVVGDKLLFRPGRVCAEFAALVRRGLFPGVSAGLSRDLSRLDHVAFLSAQNPAIGGLEPIAEFSVSTDNGVPLSIEITEAVGSLAELGSPAEGWLTHRIHNIAAILRNIKNYLIERTSAEDADRIIPEWHLEVLNDDPPAAEAEQAEFAVGAEAENALSADDHQAKYNGLLLKYESVQKTLSGVAAAMQKAVDDNTALSGRIADLEKEMRKAEFGAWVEERIAEGKVKPDEKQALVDRMENAHILTGAEFSADPVNHPKALDILKKDIMDRLRCTPALGEMSAPEFSSPASSECAMVRARLIREYMDEMEAKGSKVTATDAVYHIRQKFNL